MLLHRSCPRCGVAVCLLLLCLAAMVGSLSVPEPASIRTDVVSEQQWDSLPPEGVVPEPSNGTEPSSLWMEKTRAPPVEVVSGATELNATVATSNATAASANNGSVNITSGTPVDLADYGASIGNLSSLGENASLTKNGVNVSLSISNDVVSVDSGENVSMPTGPTLLNATSATDLQSYEVLNSDLFRPSAALEDHMRPRQVFWSEAESKIRRHKVESVPDSFLNNAAPAEMPAPLDSNRQAVHGRHQYTIEDVVAQVTIVIKTFERRNCLINTLTMIRKQYPTIAVVVVDDSKEVAETIRAVEAFEHVRYFPVQFDAGVSSGRNFGVDKVSTPLTLMMDDDQMMTEDTRLQDMMDDLYRHDAHIVGGCNEDPSTAGGQNCKGDWDMFLSNKEMMSPAPTYRSLHVIPYAHKFMDYAKQRDGTFNQTDLYCKDSDMVSSFFLARTSFLSKQNHWDPFFKVGEMVDFFYRAKTKRANIRFCTNSLVLHRSATCLSSYAARERYDRFRDREGAFMEYFFIKHRPISTLKLPLATVRYECGCDPEHIDEYPNKEECLREYNWTNRPDCWARWDGDNRVYGEEEDNVLYSMHPQVTPKSFMPAAKISMPPSSRSGQSNTVLVEKKNTQPKHGPPDPVVNPVNAFSMESNAAENEATVVAPTVSSKMMGSAEPVETNTKPDSSRIQDDDQSGLKARSFEDDLGEKPVSSSVLISTRVEVPTKLQMD